MKKLILTFLTISSIGTFSLAYAYDCGCKGDPERCTCIECECPSAADNRDQTEEDRN